MVLPNPSERWGRGGTPKRLNSRATPHGLDQKSKMEVPKMARRRDSDAGQSRRYKFELTSEFTFFFPI